MTYRTAPTLAVVLGVGTVCLLGLGVMVGSLGFEPMVWDGGVHEMIVRDIRLPRTLGAWLAGALLGLGGALAQGLFRNPLADPFLLGSASGASLGVAVFLLLLTALEVDVNRATAEMTAFNVASSLAQLGLTGAAFVGAVLAVLLTLALSQGAQQTMRLLLGGVVVGMVLGALVSLISFWRPEIWRSMQGFMLGTTGFLGWTAVTSLAVVLLLCLGLSLALCRVLDALALGEATAQSLGVPLHRVRLLLVLVLALATGAAVAQVGLVAFIGLVAPHLVRASVRSLHAWLLPLSAMMGGVLLLLADVLARWVLAPQELPVGVLTAVLGGFYLLMLMYRRPL